jgi:phage terminase small subunit
MKGRRPLPTNWKVLRGNHGKRPLNRNEPQPEIPDKPPEPPDYLGGGYAREEWVRLVPELHALGLLTSIDVSLLGVYCSAYGRWRNALETLNRIESNDPNMNDHPGRSRGGAEPFVGDHSQ